MHFSGARRLFRLARGNGVRYAHAMGLNAWKLRFWVPMTMPNTGENRSKLCQNDVKNFRVPTLKKSSFPSTPVFEVFSSF